MEIGKYLCDDSNGIKLKGLKLTTIAIVGSGIVGTSLAYALSKQNIDIHKVTIFSADHFTSPCTLNSTATVALRGISKGHSQLGDLLVEGFDYFSKHVLEDRPSGVEQIFQHNVATIFSEQFHKRFPKADVSTNFLKQPCWSFQEEAFLVDPRSYLDWLFNMVSVNRTFEFEQINEFVVEVTQGDKVRLKTSSEEDYFFDRVIFAGGSYNRFWKNLMPDSKLKTSQPVQGCYFEFNNIDWNLNSFSLTIDGDNVVWNKFFQRLFVGSTTDQKGHLIPFKHELVSILNRLKEKSNLLFPDASSGIIKVGLREKAQKREPYFLRKNNLFFLGGFYKNAFILSLLMSNKVVPEIIS